MPKRIVLIDGHPDPSPERYVHALRNAYSDGAHEAGHDVKAIVVSEMDFPLLRTNADFRKGKPPRVIQRCQQYVADADHLVIFFPLWLGTMPALLKGFLEQLLRPGFAFGEARGRGMPKKLLAGKSARIVVTMGMPSFFYRWYYREHSLKSLKQNILGFCGISPIRESIVGMVEGMSAQQRQQWLTTMEILGRTGR